MAAYDLFSDTTGLGLGFRLRWRAEYLAFSVLGPASRPAETDPRARLRRERAARLIEGYRARGQEPPTELSAIAETGRLPRR